MFNRLQPVFLQRGAHQLGTGATSQLFNAVMGSVLLYGSDVWCLSSEQQSRLHTFTHKLAQLTLKGRRHSDDDKYADVRIPPVATLLRRRQLRWIGHVFRRDEYDLVRIMLSAMRKGGAGVASAMGLTGANGTYNKLLRDNLTSVARRKFFGASRYDPHALAQDRDQWREFSNNA